MWKKLSEGNSNNRKVKKVAAGYKSQGYNVLADIPGYKKPKNFGGRRADVVAIKGKDKVLVEVETKKSMISDSIQRRAIKKIAKRSGYRFRTTKTRWKI